MCIRDRSIPIASYFAARYFVPFYRSQDSISAVSYTHLINAGRLPVLVCISDTSIVESIHLAHVGAECGASAVVSAPPYYFAPGQPELAEFYEDLIPQLQMCIRDRFS